MAGYRLKRVRPVGAPARLAISHRSPGRAFLVAPGAARQRSGREELHQADGVALRATRQAFPSPSAPGEPISEQPVRASAQLSDRGRLRDALARR